ncbi:MAG: hypothetical protein M1829_001738 [Trizodia sp. TS-e1964]|nr:MAG: hypothetical protein M1829_001738 [Trizodia sp. TS-e1964]
MPRAEVGSTKHLNNKLKSKGLQRLRWYCQACERQMRDENGFKCHTQSESHVRQMLLIGEDPKKHIRDFSNQFQKDFIQLLRTSHGEKKININHFYQEYIANKEHVHMNATCWPSLTEFAKYLGREGICRVEDDDEKGIQVAWIDNSPEALRRQDAIRKKERQDRGDEEREQKLIQAQVARAQIDAEAKGIAKADSDLQTPLRVDGEKVRLDFSMKSKSSKVPAGQAAQDSLISGDLEVKAGPIDPDQSNEHELVISPSEPQILLETAELKQINALKKVAEKPKNVFALASKKRSLAGKKGNIKELPKKQMSEAERIMKEEIERKRIHGPGSFNNVNKRPKLS